MRIKPSRLTKSFSVGAQWSKEKLGIAKPSTFDSDFLITEKTYRALEQLLRDLIRYIVIYLQPKSRLSELDILSNSHKFRNQKHLVIETQSEMTESHNSEKSVL